jgi:hypothetical protein
MPVIRRLQLGVSARQRQKRLCEAAGGRKRFAEARARAAQKGQGS